ncbi:MAG: glycosyltransferase, partial [Salibacteraceae bacterium]
MRLLIISSVGVEPGSSAAGARMMQLIGLFHDLNFSISYASTAATSDFAVPLKDLGIDEHFIKVNDPSFDEFVLGIKPEMVLFDRFMTEEQFGWRVAKQCPDALRVLDTEDLHCLRNARQSAVSHGIAFEESQLIRDGAFRELASIWRCDLSLIISSFEMELLQRFFKVDEALLHYLPFVLSDHEMADQTNLKKYEDRADFVSIGNFRHAPNLDAVHQLKHHHWPVIRAELPNARLHIYGAYAFDEVLQMHDEQSGFLVRGRASSAEKVISDAKVMLAPLRFGAGLKGKLIDAMRFGTPSVTTTIGAEAMHGNHPWNGAIADEAKEFKEAAVQLYRSRTRWKRAQTNGSKILKDLFHRSHHQAVFNDRLKQLMENYRMIRQKN